MHEIVTLSITSYRGSIGGEHYYGKFHVQTKMTRVTNPDGTEGYVTRMGYGAVRHPNDDHELKRALTAKEAAYLNKKDDEGFFTSSMGLKRGDLTTRFNDVPSIIAAAIEAFPTLFDETDILEYSKVLYEGRPEILVAPADVVAAIGGTPTRQEREEWLMANGYMILETQPDGDAKTGEPS